MSSITTHILDVSIGSPASGISIVLDVREGGDWKQVGTGVTDGDGRVRSFLTDNVSLEEGIYRLTFETGAYFSGRSIDSFYPQVTVTFTISNTSQHYHVPLLLSPFGYSTYRGS